MKLRLLICLLAAAVCLCPITLRADTVLVGLADPCQPAVPCMPAHASSEGVQFTLTTASYGTYLLVDSVWIDTPQISSSALLELIGSSIDVQTTIPYNPDYLGPFVLGIGRLPAGSYTFVLDGLGGVMAYDVGSGSLGCCGFIAGVSGEGGGMPAFELDGEPISSTPEPSTLLMLGFGVLGLAGVTRRNVAPKFRARMRLDPLIRIR